MNNANRERSPEQALRKKKMMVYTEYERSAKKHLLPEISWRQSNCKEQECGL